MSTKETKETQVDVSNALKVELSEGVVLSVDVGERQYIVRLTERQQGILDAWIALGAETDDPDVNLGELLDEWFQELYENQLPAEEQAAVDKL